MTINIISEVKADFAFHYKKLAEKVIQASLDAEDFPYEAEVTITITDNAGIHEINRQMRNIDRPTDVLSFPMLEFESPSDFSYVEEYSQECVNPDTDEVMLGDIVLSVDKIKAQAEEYGHSEKREYAFLITHSMLHLMGYDHMVPEDAALMEERQRVILDSIHMKRV